MDDRTIGLIANAAILAALGAFWPQILRFLYKIGYRDWRDPNWKPPEKK